MEKISSVIAAIEAGKLPSTEQLDTLDDWLTHSAIPAVEPNEVALSPQGRTLASDVRDALISYNLLNTHKNADNQLQEAIWHLTEGDLNSVIEPSKDFSEKTQVESDIKAVRSSLRTVLSIVWQNFTDGGFLPTSVTSFFLLTLSDAAEGIQSQAGRTKNTLRDLEQDVQEGQRDSLGRDKAKLEETQGDKRAAFERTMDTVKSVGGGAIDAHQSATATAQDLKERSSNLLWDSYFTACERAQNDPTYHSALSTLLNIVQKWIHEAFRIVESDKSFTLESLIEDPSPEQHVHKALDSLKILLDRIINPNCSVDDVLGATRSFFSAMRANSDEFKAWVDEFFAHVHKSLDDAEYPASDEARRVSERLRTRRRELLDPETEAGRAWEILQEKLRLMRAAVVEDSDVQRVQEAHIKLGNDVKDSFVDAGAQAVLQGTTWFWRDLFVAYAPRFLAMLKDVPIPRTEYIDNDLELVLENMDVSSFAVNPSHIFIQNSTDVDVKMSETSEATTGVGTYTHIRLQAVQLTLKDVSFYYKDKDKTSALQPSEFTGILGLTLPPQGLDVDVKLRLIPHAKERKEKRGYYRIEGLDVQIANDVKLTVKKSNHNVMVSLFKPVFNKRFREALSRSLASQFRTLLDGLDGVLWDVGRRAEVFTDSGMARGASLAAAVWSEIGHLLRERSWGLHATGTGVVVEGGVERDAPKFAMGAEPQILPGEKRGPMGTASESVESRTGARVGGDADARGRSAGDQTTGAVQSFKQSLDEKVAREKRNPGWKSAAFDL
ncbi:hypothetical protein R3P38DRAFT_3360324 [Favolaschia claudopus]|uniref:Uncharacterized protein n=1 Tax=Favolaschia claudopus TaxID=2862362 RepID=A0AAW0B0B5_9AGAR